MSSRVTSAAIVSAPPPARTSSVSTPPVDLGCTNATRLFRIPVRGSSSISRRPAERSLLQGGVDVVGLVGHVVQARAVALEEAAHGALGVGRAEQLHVRVADPEQRGLHAELLHRLAVLVRHAEAVAVERDRAVEVLHGHSDVVDPPEHGPGSVDMTAPWPI